MMKEIGRVQQKARRSYGVGPIASTWKNPHPPVGNACNQPKSDPALVDDIELG